MFHNLSSLVLYWRAVLPLFAVVLLSPGRASAECGDYITIRGSTSNTQLSHSMPFVDRMGLYEVGFSIPIKKPCQGPNCSSSPQRESPPITPVFPVSARVKELVKQAELTDDTPARNSSLLGDDFAQKPIDRAFSIYHPPRV
jgi:hypothetical protein